MAAGTTVPAGTIAAVGDQQNIGFPQGGPLRVWINENGTASRSLLPVPTAPSMGGEQRLRAPSGPPSEPDRLVEAALIRVSGITLSAGP